MRRRTVLISGVVATVLAVTAVAVARPILSERSAPFIAAVWLPVWDERGTSSLGPALENGVTEVSPTWATVRPGGALALTPPAPEVVLRLGQEGVLVVPLVQNFDDGAWQGEMVADILADPVLARAHREALIEAALTNGWDGIDIDYENLPPMAGPQFIDFLTALRDDLHQHDLMLSVAVPARESDDDSGTLAYSYQKLGQVADQVRLMTYDHSWSTSEAGPVAPVEWIEAVVAYAVERVPREKVMLGLATYGYDWVGGSGKNLQATDAVALAERVGVEPTWDDNAAASTFDYSEDGQAHTVWYENARSLELKQRIALAEGLRGVAIWHLGGEDPGVWTSIRTATRGEAGS
jgi:spore germination protein